MGKHSSQVALLSAIVFLGFGVAGAAQSNEVSRTAAAVRPSHANYPTDWWSSISRRSDSWFRSDDGRRVAENILSWQHENGGWPLMNTTNEPFEGDVSRAGPWGTKGALIKATVNEIRFLARESVESVNRRLCESESV